MAPPDLVENGDRPQARSAREQRHHLAVPNRRQRVMPPATTRCPPLRREPRVLFDAIGGGGAEPGFGRGNTRRFGLAETHEQPHLAIGDVATGQGAVPHRREEPASYPAGRDRQTTRPFQGHTVRRIRNVSRATPSCCHASGDTFSSRSTPASHPVCRAAGGSIFTVELYLKVRLALRDGMSAREAARHFGISRESVKKMLMFSVPPG